MRESPYRVPGTREEDVAPPLPDTLDQRIVPMLTIGFLAPLEVAAGRADRWGTAAAFAFSVLVAALLIQRRLAR